MTMPPSEPPPGENPNGDWPPGYQPPPHYPLQPRRRISVGMAFLGVFIYAMINLAVGFMAFMVAGSTSNEASNVVFGVTAVVLLLIAFGGGAVLLQRRSPDVKGIGLGLMIGWALTSVFTVGFCTALNPELYTQ